MSANAHPIGIDHQMPVSPIPGTDASQYERATRVPKESTVSTTDIPGLRMAR